MTDVLITLGCLIAAGLLLSLCALVFNWATDPRRGFFAIGFGILGFILPAVGAFACIILAVGTWVE